MAGPLDAPENRPSVSKAMDAASSGYPFARLPRLLLAAYKQVAAFFFVPGSADGFASPWMAALDLTALALGLVLFLARMGSGGLWKEHWRPVGALADSRTIAPAIVRP